MRDDVIGAFGDTASPASRSATTCARASRRRCSPAPSPAPRRPSGPCSTASGAGPRRRRGRRGPAGHRRHRRPRPSSRRASTRCADEAVAALDRRPTSDDGRARRAGRAGGRSVSRPASPAASPSDCRRGAVSTAGRRCRHDRGRDRAGVVRPRAVAGCVRRRRAASVLRDSPGSVRRRRCHRSPPRPRSPRRRPSTRSTSRSSTRSSTRRQPHRDRRPLRRLAARA